MEWVSDVYLQRINFNNGYVEFKTEDKEDMCMEDFALKTGSAAKPQKLHSVEVFDKSGVPKSKVQFDYSYFNENVSGYNKENYWRLKLNSVQESSYNESSNTY